MRFLFFAALILYSSVAFGQADNPFNTKPISPNYEVETAILHLQKIRAEDRPYIRFFTTYAVPAQLRDKTVLTLSFVLHSLTGVAENIDQGNAGSYYPLALSKTTNGNIGIRPIQRVEDSETLWWIDLRDYNWTEQAWETISSVDGYFVEPVVNHKVNGLLRLLAGNAVVRADWFIVQACDLSLQSDQDINIPIYYTLLYAQNKIPKNISDFRTIWGLNLREALQYGNEAGVIVTKSKAVARHNRAMFRYRTHLGYLYETYDVKYESGLRDYIESFAEFKGRPPTVSDAGEAFASNPLGLQVYTLHNGQGKSIDFAANEVARHLSDVTGDSRVRTSVSCMDCHSAGPIPPENTLREFVEGTGTLKLPNKQDQLRIDRTYLSGRFEDSVPEDQKTFAKALLKTNGLSPEANGKNYLEIIQWYARPLDLAQAATECGLTVDEFKEKLKNRRVSGRLALLLLNGEAIPRENWANRGTQGKPGIFQQTMISLYGLTTIKEEIKEVKRVVYSTKARCTIYYGNEQKTLPEGTIITLGKFKQRDWISIKLGDKEWWIDSRNVIQK